MRKIYFLLFTVFCFLFTERLHAQLANTYIYNASAGATLDPMTGATSIVAAGVDDTPSSLQTIGFTFNYEGIPYTQFSASPDGFIRLGSPAASSQFSNNITSTTNAPKLFPFWDDLATGTGGSVSFVVTGTAPSRILVVQWFVTVPRNTGGAANTTFQAWLYETSGKIEFRYGTGVGPSGSASIGINGATAANFISISTPANTSSTTTADNNVTALPASGTMFTFFPPPPCVPGSLTGGTTQASVPLACPNANFDLSVASASFGTGLTYQWESSPDGVSWSPVAGATSAGATVSQTAPTYYRRKMTCSGTDAYSTPLQINMNGFLNCYCSSNLTTFVNGIDIITNVLLTNAAGGTLAQASASNGTTNYVQYNNTPLDLSQSTTNSLAITFGTDGTQYSAAWIDYNQNGIFEASENIAIAAAAAGSGATVTYNFVVPAGATLGNTRMRVRGASDNAYTTGGACATTNYGETEDYLVNITPAPPCVSPTALTISAITTTTATISWTAPSPVPGAGYEWEVRTSGAGGSGATGLAASGTAAGTTASVTGLTANTVYTLYVRSVCTAGSLFSTWSGSSTFQTPCDPANVTYIQDFESTIPPAIPNCTSRETITGNPWTVVSNPGSGFTSQTLRYAYNSSQAANSWYYIQGLNLTAGTSYRLSYRYGNNSTFFPENLKVAYGTAPSAAAMTTMLADHLNIASNAAQSNQLDFVAPSTGVFYIGFQAHSDPDEFYLFVDDIKVKLTPTCDEVSNVTATGTSPTSASVSFTSTGNAFVVEYGPPGFTPGTTNTPGVGGTVVFGASSPIAIPNGLVGSTTYDVYVRRICIPGVDFSENVKTTLTTLCPATNVPYLQDFETSVPPTGLPTCTSMEDVNGNSGPVVFSGGGRWITYQGTSNQVYVSPTKTIRYIYDAVVSTRAADDWFYIQGLNLTGGTSYRLKFFYKGSDGPTWFEKLEVKYGTQAYSGAMTNPLFSNTNILTAVASPWDSAIVDFTPAATGVYYLGFHAISDADQAFLYMDDISVKVTPLVDMGATAVSVPTCPAPSGVITATIRNYNTTPENFATYPVTVTATITGASPTVLTTTVNTGTLAAGATLDVPLPAFDYIAGSYNITVSTSSPDDPEPGNDSYTKSFYVNSSPVASVITPAAAAICAGHPVQLSTQFVTPPAPPVTLPAVASGAITVNVPDASAVGAIHTLAVSAVPAGATVTGISVNMNMTHTYMGDMAIGLQAPNGKILNLFNRRGGSGDNLVNTTISSTSATSLGTGAAPFTGTYAADAGTGLGPTGLASNAAGFGDLYSIGNGNWTLVMRDYAGGDVGILTSWSITITYAFIYPNVTWTPATGLFTNAAGTTAYTAGTNSYSIYANPAATTTYTLTSTNPLTGCTSTSTVTVTVNANPVLSITALPARICLSDELVSLSATPVGGVWSGIGVSGSNFVPPNTAIGTFTLSYAYTDALGCSTTKTTTAKVEECPERIILLRDNSMILYPNPNNGQFNIRINTVLYNKLAMRIYTSSGALVHTQEIGGLAWGRVVPFNLTYLPAGTYMVQFSYVGGVRTEEKTFKVLIGH